MTTQQKAAPAVVFFVIVAALGWTLLPFKFANAVDCGPALFGGDPKSDRDVGFIRPQEDCAKKAKSRMTVAAVACFIAALGGTAAVASRGLSTSCMSGSHDSCREWWTQALGPAGQAFGCQCDCHSSGYW